jgi:hypothetical protein
MNLVVSPVIYSVKIGGKFRKLLSLTIAGGFRKTELLIFVALLSELVKKRISCSDTLNR